MNPSLGKVLLATSRRWLWSRATSSSFFSSSSFLTPNSSLPLHLNFHSHSHSHSHKPGIMASPPREPTPQLRNTTTTNKKEDTQAKEQEQEEREEKEEKEEEREVKEAAKVGKEKERESKKEKEKEEVLDRTQFKKELRLLALRVPKESCSFVTKALSGYLLDKQRLKHIVQDPNSENDRLAILCESITDSSLCQLPEDKLSLLRSQVEFKVVPYTIELDYSYWPVEHVLKDILPAGCEIPSSFETIGHIAHLNIRDDLHSYRKLIAAVILDKNPKIKTVVNKVGTISNEFRVPSFEVLAGNEMLVTEVKQHGAIFQLDYGRVYWNSRLEYEHKRLVSQFRRGQVVCDMFAGIGPFAIPSAQIGCRVFANDLNPHSTMYLKINAILNNVADNVHVFNMDARLFMKQVLNGFNLSPESELGLPLPEYYCEGTGDEKRRQGEQEDKDDILGSAISPGVFHRALYKEEKKKKLKALMSSCTAPTTLPIDHIDHIIMNLPASALEFLDVFQGLLSSSKWKGSMPWIHCYCFMRASETIEDILQRAETILNCSIKEPNVHTVRDVAPNKVMLCVSFILPETIAFSRLG